jgi:hypothetical protein
MQQFPNEVRAAGRREQQQQNPRPAKLSDHVQAAIAASSHPAGSDLGQ